MENEQEFTEDADFQVIGETDPPEDVDSEEEDGVPIRVLTDFAIYEVTTQRLVPIAELLSVNHGTASSYAASGCVKAWIDDNWLTDSNEDAEAEDDHTSESHDDLSQRVRLSCIKKFTLHDMKKQGRGLDRHGTFTARQRPLTFLQQIIHPFSACLVYFGHAIFGLQAFLYWFLAQAPHPSPSRYCSYGISQVSVQGIFKVVESYSRLAR